jgi:hypothetical protein
MWHPQLPQKKKQKPFFKIYFMSFKIDQIQKAIVLLF